MSRTTAPATGRVALPGTMGSTLRGYWTGAEGYQRFLYLVGAALIAGAAVHGAVLVLAGGTLEGPVSWRKPVLFGEAFGLTALTVGWVMTFLPKRRALGWALAGALGVANFGEVFLVTMQQWRGAPSHFNNATAFDAAVFGAMGVLILFTVSVIVISAVRTCWPLDVPASLAWAIRAGMVLLVISQAFGLLMIQRGGNSFGEAGAMKLPHALALHGAQVLPALAWVLLWTRWSAGRQRRLVAVGVVGYSLLVAVAALQMFNGRAPFDLSIAAEFAAAAAAVLLGGAWLKAVLGLKGARSEPAGSRLPPRSDA